MKPKKQNRWRRLLRKAANLLERKNWRRGGFSFNKNGYVCDVFSPEACQFCAMGAILSAEGKYGKLSSKAIHEIGNRLNGHTIVSYNDCVATSKYEIIKLFRRAANS